MTMSRRLLGRGASGREQFNTAEAYLRESLGVLYEMGYRYAAARALADLGTLERRRGALTTARENFEVAVEQYCDIGAIRDAVRTYERLSAVCEATDDLEAANENCEAARRLTADAAFVDLPASLDERHTRIRDHLHARYYPIVNDPLATILTYGYILPLQSTLPSRRY